MDIKRDYTAKFLGKGKCKIEGVCLRFAVPSFITDTLYSFANHYRTSIGEIKRLNGINEASNLITAGQILIVKI